MAFSEEQVMKIIGFLKGNKLIYKEMTGGLQ